MMIIGLRLFSASCTSYDSVQLVDDDHAEESDEFEYDKDIVHAAILPTISTISCMVRPDVVHHLHLSPNFSIFPLFVEPGFDEDDGTDRTTEEGTPLFLIWSETSSLHVQGKGMAGWIVPYVSRTIQLMLREGRDWRSSLHYT